MVVDGDVRCQDEGTAGPHEAERIVVKGIRQVFEPLWVFPGAAVSVSALSRNVSCPTVSVCTWPEDVGGSESRGLSLALLALLSNLSCTGTLARQFCRIKPVCRWGGGGRWSCCPLRAVSLRYKYRPEADKPCASGGTLIRGSQL